MSENPTCRRYYAVYVDVRPFKPSVGLWAVWRGITVFPVAAYHSYAWGKGAPLFWRLWGLDVFVQGVPLFKVAACVLFLFIAAMRVL